MGEMTRNSLLAKFTKVRASAKQSCFGVKLAKLRFALALRVKVHAKVHAKLRFALALTKHLY